MPLAGTAPTVSGWLVVEQAIPWAARALESERLDQSVRAALQRVEATVLLARRFGVRVEAEPRFWYVDWRGDDLNVVTARVRDLVEAIDHGRDIADIDSTLPNEPALFICTNGKRDICCAIESRPLLDDLSDREDVWECTHIGGHRFAPTALLFPYGIVYGRLTAAVAREALDFAGRREVSMTSARGSTRLSDIEQVVDIHIRQRFRVVSPRPLTMDVAGSPNQPLVRAFADDGRAWEVQLQARRSAPVAEACGRELLPERYWSVESIAVSR